MNAQGQPLEPVREEFWADAIGTIKQRFPGFLFLAEAYWDLEDRLCELGFDYAYDKKLYDLVMHRDPAVPAHLRGLGARNWRRAHFLENHDEPRAHARLPVDAHRGAALLTLALPGMRFLHDGQLEGRRRFARIQLHRRLHEEPDAAVVDVYEALLGVLPETAVGRGDCDLVAATPAWEGNASHDGFTLVQWQRGDDAGAFDLVVVNHRDHRAQCWARLSARGLQGGSWQLHDLLGHERYERSGDELASRGLYLDVAPHAAQLFRFRR